MFLSTVCDTFSGITSLHVQERLQCPHNVHLVFSSALRFLLQPVAVSLSEATVYVGVGDTSGCSLPATRQIQGASCVDCVLSEGTAAQLRQTEFPSLQESEAIPDQHVLNYTNNVTQNTRRAENTFPPNSSQSQPSLLRATGKKHNKS